MDVREEDHLAVAESVRNARLPTAEHAEVGVDRLGRVQLVVVSPEPAERAARLPDHPAEIDLACAEAIEVALREVLPHHADEPDRRVHAGRHGEVRGRAAEHLAPAVERGFDIVVGE